jgi:hypothetical protein
MDRMPCWLDKGWPEGFLLAFCWVDWDWPSKGYIDLNAPEKAEQHTQRPGPVGSERDWRRMCRCPAMVLTVLVVILCSNI